MEQVPAITKRGVRALPRGAVGILMNGFLLGLVVVPLARCAPQVSPPEGAESAKGDPPLSLANPFGPSEENRRLRQSYIKANLKEGQARPDLNSWEQEVFFLFSLHDYDRSGQMDGLEVMQLLSEFLAHHSPKTPKSTESVVSSVDYLLQTQDLNQDGLLAPSELLSAPIPPHQQQNQHGKPDKSIPQQGEGEAGQQGGEQQASDSNPEPQQHEGEEHQQGAEEEPSQEHQQELQEPAEEQQNQIQEDEQVQDAADEQLNQIQEPAKDQQSQQAHIEQNKVPVHQGQPEM